MKNALMYGIVFAAISIIFPVGVTGLFMQMTPEVKEVTPYIMRVFSLSYIPQAVCVYCVFYLQSIVHPKKATIVSLFYLQSIVHPKKATIVSLLRGVILNGAFLMIFPVFFGGNSIWWAIFMAHPKKATIVSLLRGVILNGAFLMIFPVFFGGNSIWWAIFMAEFVTMLVAIVYMVKIYREHKKK